MNNRFLLSLLFIALSLSVWAERVPEGTVRQVAQQVLSTFSPLRSQVSPVLAYQAPSKLRADEGADYYIYVPEQGTGFVIVSGDNRSYPVLGYSPSDQFSADHMPIQMIEWLDGYQKELELAKSTSVPEPVERQWEAALRGDLRLGTGRELNTPTWNQGNPFNRMTPTVNGEQTLVGCVALSMGMIMAYHQYPERVINPPASNYYYVEGTPKSVSIDYSEPYDWDNILQRSYSAGSYNETQAMAVSRLLYHCGANVEMNYGLKESGAVPSIVPKVLRDVFSYSPDILPVKKALMTWDAWKGMIRADIDEGLPVFYGGQGSGAHAFVCDGYKDEYFHFNWGWGGFNNGYYLLTALTPGSEDYSSEQHAIFHIRPTRSGGISEPFFTVTDANYTIEGNYVQSKFYVYYAGLDAIGYQLGLGVVNSQNKITQFPSGDIFSFKFEPSAELVRSFSITLNHQLVAGEKVVLLGSSDGDQWRVLPTAPTVPIGLGPDGPILPPADETDDPADPIYFRVLSKFSDGSYFYPSSIANDETVLGNINGISYQLNKPRAITFTYTISDYDQWKGCLAIFAKNGSNLNQAYAGEAVAIDENGRFSVRERAVTTSSSSIYSHHLKFLASKRGTLRFSVVAVTDGVEQPLYSQDDVSMHFVNRIDTEWELSRVEGKVNGRMILKPRLTNLDPIFENEDIHLYMRVEGLTLDEFELYRSDGEPIPMVSYKNYETRCFSKDHTLIWVKGNRLYDIVFVPKVTIPSEAETYITTTAYHQNKEIPGRSFICYLIANEDQTANELVEADSPTVSMTSDGVMVSLNHDAEITIYGLDGRIVHAAKLSVGDHRIALPKGYYVIQVNDETFKIAR